MKPCSETETHRVLQYGLYPFLLIAMLGYAALELSLPAGQVGRYYAYYLSALVVLMLLVETLHPLRSEWRMTKASFLRRDLPFMLIGGISIGLSNYAAGWAALHFGLARGDAHAALPLVPAVLLALVIPDFIWYWVHRLSHEGRGRFGGWLWKMHLAHHLPQQVYLLMHAVAHPVNTIEYHFGTRDINAAAVFPRLYGGGPVCRQPDFRVTGFCFALQCRCAGRLGQLLPDGSRITSLSSQCRPSASQELWRGGHALGSIVRNLLLSAG